MTRSLGLLAGLALLASRPDLPKDVHEAFQKATQFDLYSLDPANETREGFHGWTVLGKTTVKGDRVAELRKALEKGMDENKDSEGACFITRNGIRLVLEKKTYDLVICFQCLQIYVYEGEKEVGWSLTSRSPAELFNKVLSDAKVPLPPK